MKYYINLFLFVIIIYFVYKQKQKIGQILSSLGITDYFNYSRPWTKEEQEKIKQLGNEKYRAERDKMVKSGQWKFPGLKCATVLQQKYKLSEFQRDGLAAYDTFSKIAERLKNMTYSKINLTGDEVEKICGGVL